MRRIDNPWLPFRPRTVWVYRGVKDGEPARDVVRVTARTKVVDGVRCTAVEDRLYVRGISLVKEETVRGGDERAVLVALRRR